MGNRSAGNSVAAMVIVGLGMLLIAGLSGVVLYVVTHRKAVTQTRASEIPTGGTEPAEA